MASLTIRLLRLLSHGLLLHLQSHFVAAFLGVLLPLLKTLFLSIFHEVMPSTVDFSCDASVEELLSRFNSTCSNVLNAVAPFRTFQSKTRSEPWIDDSIRSLRRCCRRAERKWKKDRLHVSFEILKDTLFKYQKAVKKAKCRHLSDIINKNCSSTCSCGSVIEHCVSSAKGRGFNSQGTHVLIKKLYSLNAL